jgi:hypothetical protein
LYLKRDHGVFVEGWKVKAGEILGFLFTVIWDMKPAWWQERKSRCILMVGPDACCENSNGVKQRVSV